MQMLFHKKQRTPLGFCDGLDNTFVGFGSKDERGCRPPKYHASYAPYYPIHKAASTGDVETVKSFVERGVFAMEQVDWKYRTALHFACVYGHPEVVTLLVESSCEINPKDIKDATPLIKASQCRQTECLDILLKHGADPNTMDCSDNTALHYAVYNGDIKTATKLLEYKANIEAVNENKITPLLLALKQNKEKMAEFLINNGANIKMCDFLGRSSLMYAVRCGSELIIKLLLQRNIDTFKQDVFGWTAKRYAVESKSKVRKLLIDYDEEELRQRCSETTRRYACITPTLPTMEVKDSPQSEALKKIEARPSESEPTEEDTCIMPILPTTDDDDDDIVEKAEARPSKLESTEIDASSMPTTTKVEDFPQNAAAEEAEANPSQSAWTEKDDSLKPTTTEKKPCSDDVEIITLKAFNSEEVIKVSSEEEQKGEDEEDGDGSDEEDGDDGDEDGDDEDSGDDNDGTGYQKLVVEETKQSAGKSNQEDPSNKLSVFQEDEDSTEDSEEVATEQPLGKDEEPKSQRGEDSDKTSEREETEQPLGQDKTSIPQTVEDAAEDSEEEARKQPVEKSNPESHCQKANNDKNLSQIFEDSRMDSEEEAPEQPVGRSNQGSPCKQTSKDGLTYDKTSILQKLEDSRDDSESVFECLSKKGIDHLCGAADQSGDKPIKVIEMNDSDPKVALGVADGQTLTSANSDSEVTSTENEKSYSDSTINSPLTIFEYLPRKEENGYLTGSTYLQGQNTATRQMKEPAADVTSREEEESDNGSECTQAFSTSGTYGLKKILGYLRKISDQRTQNMVTGGMTAEVKDTTSREEHSQSESSVSDSWTFSDPLPQRVNVSPLTRSRDQTGENMAREELKGNKVTPIENLRRHYRSASVDSLSSQSMSEHPPREQDVGHLPETADPRLENTGNGEMKVFSDFSKESPPQLKLTIKRKSSFLNRAVAKRQERSWESAEPDKELTLIEEQRSHVISERSESLQPTTDFTQQKDVEHLTGAGDQRRENQTRYTMGALCKEVTTTEEKGRYDSQKNFQSLVIPEPHPLNEDIVCCTGIPGQERENVVNMEMKVPSTEVKFTEEHKTNNNFESTESMKIDVNHLPGTANLRRKTITSGEMKGSPKEYPLQFKEPTIQRGSVFEYAAVAGIRANTSKSEEPGNEETSVKELKRHGSHQSLQSWTTSETSTDMEDVVCFPVTIDQILENMANAKTKAKPDNKATSTEGQTRAYNKERVKSVKPGKEDLAVSTEERSETLMQGQTEDLCKEAALTEEQRRNDTHGFVQTLKKSVSHLGVTKDHRIESKATTKTKAKPHRGVMTTTKVKRRQENMEKLRTLIKQKRKTGLSSKMDTVEKPSYCNTAAAGGDGDNTAAISGTDIRNGVIQQMHCGKARNHQFPVTKKKHIGLNKKTSRKKNKPLKYMDAMDDHQLSESLSEDYEDYDYDFPDYDNILMIVDQLQMKYKDSGKPQEIQDAIRSYKMIVESNQRFSELLIKKSKNMRNQGGKVMKKPREREKAKLQLKCKNEEQQLDLIDVGSPEKQEVQQRNADGCYEKMKKQLTEKEQQYKREKQQLELRLRAQDTELQHLRDDINKLQEARHPETEAGHSDSMMKEHLQKVEHEVFKLVETIKKQTETIEQLERKLPREEKTLAGTGHLTQIGRELFNAFREMFTTTVMSQLELRIQHLEREFSEIKTRTRENVMVLENYVKLNQSHKLMETEAKLKEVMAQFVMLTQHNTALQNLLSSSVLASECPCMANFHRRLGSLFTQENTLTPEHTSGPQPSNQYITAHLDAPADDNEDVNKALTKSVLSPQPELHPKKEKCLEPAKERTPSKKCFKPTKTSTVCENGEHSFSEILNTRQFEKNIPIDELQHEIIREDQGIFDNAPGNHSALLMSPWELGCTNLESEHPEETTCQALYKTESEQHTDPCLEWVAMTSSSSQGQLRSKDRQDGSKRRNFNKTEAYTSTPNMCMMSSAPEFGSGQLYNSLGYSRNFLQREPLMTSSRLQAFESSLSFLNRVSEENQQTSHDKVGNPNASRIKPQKSTLSNLKSQHTEEVTHQALRKAKPKHHEEPYHERTETTKPLTYDQLKLKDRQDESMRRNFDKTEAYNSVPNMHPMTSPTPGFGSGQLYNSLEYSGGLMQEEATTPSLRPWHFVESLDSYLCRTWQQLSNHY
ncbi:ankyrin repeat domain-containing protein 36C-like isoform X4 [Mastomys coucha]|uniref:ankyrin repeat domain-containing protein 36C-like isoform X4 n=1 Tax=Mastomys coucha TaxID=35658 RepID=UPI00126218E6|nr:ankyrin repeat domain-containing protein 36C-like isoform X4 [Mastomys coucha]